MFWIVLLMFILGVLLFLLEAVLPWGISAFGGLALIGAGLMLSWRADPETTLPLILVAFPVAGLLAYWVFRKGLGTFTLDADKQTETASESAADHGDAPGKGEVVRVVQPLRPTGTVEWQQRRFAARSLRPEVESSVGCHVRVTGRDSVYLTVEPVENDEPARA